MNVANRDDLAILVRQEAVEDLIAAIADADEAEADTVVGAEDAVVGGGSSDAGQGGALGELSAIYFCHVSEPFVQSEAVQTASGVNESGP